MLWQKESECEDALYIDLSQPSPNKLDEFKKCTQFYENGMFNVIERNFRPNKDNDYALKLRKEGNALFGESKWDQAMDKYNRSLCYAENDSELIGLAYANRSSCFLRLKMFDKCLIDIDLAKKAAFPEHLIAKLETRGEDCLKSIEDGLQAVSNEAKLSYEPHPNYPGMVNHLSIVTDPKYGRGVITTKDMDVGDTVLLEPIYFGESYVRKYETCSVCLKTNTNLVPCRTCTFAMLCFDGCKHGDLHRLECGIRKCPTEGDDLFVGMIVPIIRSILMATRMFSNTFELMKFVEQAISSDPMEIPTTIDDKLTYRAFLKVHKEGLNDIKPHHIHLFYELLLGQSELTPYFTVEKYRRFFTHLIMHHVAVYKSNKITNQRLIGNVGAILSQINYIYEDDCMGLLKTYFNHSCAPTITFYCDNGFIVGKIIRPVKNGEQIFVSYYGNLLGLTWNDRNDPMAGKFSFDCNCFRCESRVDDNQDSSFSFNYGADYIFLRGSFSPNRSYPNERTRRIVEEKCIRFLREFGRDDWSYALEYVMEAYCAALKRSTSSPISKYHYLTNIVEKPGLNHTMDMFEQAIRELLW